MQIRVENLNVAAAFNVSGSNFTRTRCINTDGARLAVLHTDAELFERQHDARHIIPHTGNRGELVENTIDLDGGDRRSVQG